MKFKITAVICFLLAILVYSCDSEADITFKRYYTTGSIVYQTKCQNCHGKDGQGLSSLMPPLTDSSYLRANKKLLACFVKYGMKDKIVIVNKKAYDADMPPQDLAPIEIAQVLTYINNSFGNNLGLMTGEDVEKDLKGCK
ncbi:MAG: cytochrome c [Bacteroidota bacterium]